MMNLDKPGSVLELVRISSPGWSGTNYGEQAKFQRLPGSNLDNKTAPKQIRMGSSATNNRAVRAF